MKKLPIAYVYEWTELSTGMRYVGSRTAKNSHPDDGYICSSKIVKPMIIENPSGWTREILGTGSPQDMRELEIKILHEVNAAKNPAYYNKTNGDARLYGCHLGYKQPEHVKKKRAEKLKGKKHSDERNEQKRQRMLSNPTRGMLGKQQSEKQKQAARMANLGKKQTEETRKKQSQIGKERCKSPEERQRMKEMRAKVKSRKGTMYPKQPCIKCQKLIGINNMAFHLTKCKGNLK
jgi:hypothetical protein